MKKRHFLLSLLFLGFIACVNGQHVSNVRYQISDTSVIIHYDLDIIADISVYVSTDNGKSYSKELCFVEGAVGTNIHPGRSLKIIWPINTVELPENLLFKIDAKHSKHDVEKTNKSKVSRNTFKPFACVIGGINCDFSPQFKWEGIGGWVGYMKRIGFYFNFSTNWQPNKSNIPLSEYDTSLDYYAKNKLRRSYDFGLLIRTCKPLSIKIGCGYGKYKEFVLMNYDFYPYSEWKYNPRTSIQGFEFNFGLLFHMNWFNISLETAAIKFKHFDIRLGFGFSLKSKK